MDESFEALTLIQTRMIQQFPIVLRGERILELPAAATTMDERRRDDRSSRPETVLITDSVQEAMRHIQRHAAVWFATAQSDDATLVVSS